MLPSINLIFRSKHRRRYFTLCFSNLPVSRPGTVQQIGHLFLRARGIGLYSFNGYVGDWQHYPRPPHHYHGPPAPADDLYIVGELTGAGTKTTRTVTMNSTAATAYGNGAVNSTSVAGGGVHISNWGTLTYGTTAGTNYLLRVAGDVIVYQYGTLNMGSSAATVFTPASLTGLTAGGTLA